jgi:hypothetical protein
VPVSGCCDSQSNATLKPMSWLLPMPTTWLKPTPLGPAQSTTARAIAEDWASKARRPGGGGMWEVVASRRIEVTARPKL